MPFAKRGDVVHSEATSGFNNQKKSLLINGLAALGDSLRPLQIPKDEALLFAGLCRFWLVLVSKDTASQARAESAWMRCFGSL